MSNSAIKNLFFLIHKRCFVTSSKLPPRITKDSNFALHFLTNTCGLPLKSAISVSNKFPIQENNEKQLNSVINYLKAEGFSQTHISILIQKLPTVLHSNVKTTIKPKLEFLKQNGFVGEILIEILVRNPYVVKVGLGSQLKPCFELLRSYLVSDDKIVFAIRRSMWSLSSNFKKVIEPNIGFLVNQRLPSTSIAKLLIFQPRIMCFKHSRLIDTVNAVKELGLQPSSPVFVHAFRFVICLKNCSWKKKMQFFQSLGWSQEDVLSAFKIFPQLLSYSDGRIRKSIDFYVNTMKLDMQTIITKPVLLGYAIDTRVRPRYSIFKILESKKLIKENIMTFSWIFKSNTVFLDKYVIKYEDSIPGLLDIFTAGKRAEVINA